MKLCIETKVASDLLEKNLESADPCIAAARILRNVYLSSSCNIQLHFAVPCTNLERSKR